MQRVRLAATERLVGLGPLDHLEAVGLSPLRPLLLTVTGSEKTGESCRDRHVGARDRRGAGDEGGWGTRHSSLR